MKCLKYIICSALLLISFNSLAGVWVPASNGYIPRGAWAVGYEEDGSPLFLCRATFHGVHPGKLRREFRGCNISYAGREMTIRNYSVYLNRAPIRPTQPPTRFFEERFDDQQ